MDFMEREARTGLTSLRIILWDESQRCLEGPRRQEDGERKEEEGARERDERDLALAGEDDARVTRRRVGSHQREEVRETGDAGALIVGDVGSFELEREGVSERKRGQMKGAYALLEGFATVVVDLEREENCERDLVPRSHRWSKGPRNYNPAP